MCELWKHEKQFGCFQHDVHRLNIRTSRAESNVGQNGIVVYSREMCLVVDVVVT